jgi:hypothetical protein
VFSKANCADEGAAPVTTGSVSADGRVVVNTKAESELTPKPVEHE